MPGPVEEARTNSQGTFSVHGHGLTRYFLCTWTWTHKVLSLHMDMDSQGTFSAHGHGLTRYFLCTWTWTHKVLSLHMDTPVLGDQQGFTYISSVWTLNAVKKSCQERWVIGMDGGERSNELRVRVFWWW